MQRGRNEHRVSFLNIDVTGCVCMPECIYACVTCQSGRRQRSKEGAMAPGSGIPQVVSTSFTGDCELPYGVWEPNLGPLQHQ